MPINFLYNVETMASLGIISNLTHDDIMVSV